MYWEKQWLSTTKEMHAWFQNIDFLWSQLLNYAGLQ